MALGGILGALGGGGASEAMGAEAMDSASEVEKVNEFQQQANAETGTEALKTAESTDKMSGDMAEAKAKSGLATALKSISDGAIDAMVAGARTATQVG